MSFNPNAGVPPLAAITRPYGITPLDKPVYYCATLQNCSMHRGDGKKIPFVSGFFKATLQEDVFYLDEEIRVGNIYIRRANVQEQEQARMMEDPLGVIKDHMRADVKKEVTEGFSVEELEQLLERKRRQRQEQNQFPSPDVRPNTFGAQATEAAHAIPADETPAQRTIRLSQEALALARSGNFRPASTADLATTADSNSRA